MTIRPKMFAFLAGCCFSMPFLEAQGKLAKFQLPADQAISCSRVGEVLGRDMFGQAFLLKQEAGGLEEIPFSRWTEFFKIPSDLGIAERRAIGRLIYAWATAFVWCSTRVKPPRG